MARLATGRGEGRFAMTPKRVSIVVGVVVVALLAISLPILAKPPSTALARNVILLIDDGAGYAHHEAGSLYDTGLRAGEAYDAFPYQLAVTTYSLGDVAVGACTDPVGYDPALAWSDFAYVTVDPTDSAAAATAMATGVKSYDAAIGVDCAGHDLDNIVQAVESMGKATGVVTSVPFNHATPAAFVAHNVARDDYIGIADEMVNSSATDVIMGGGHPAFSQPGKPAKTPKYAWIDETTWGSLEAGTAGDDADGDHDADPWTLVQARADFVSLMSGPTPGRVFGMAQVRRTLQEDRSEDLATAAPYAVPLIESVPTLAEMTTGALNVLDEDPEGFFVMIEGGATDWASHDNWSGSMVEEEIAFDRAVDAALAWVDAESNWGETLVIVTSDHETGYVTGPGSGATADGPVWNPVVDNGKAALPGLDFNLETHTNGLVPLFAKGDAGRLLGRMIDGIDPVRGAYIDNTDIHDLLVAAMGAESD